MGGKNENDLVIFIRLFIMICDIDIKILLNMFKWNIGWKYVDILKMFGSKICKLLSLIIDM